MGRFDYSRQNCGQAPPGPAGFHPGRALLTAFAAAALTVWAGGQTAEAQNAPRQCDGLLFSTSEDFTMQRGEGPDGNPIVSDGDLLAFNPATGLTTICLRNAELLRPYDIQGVDLGLDAVAAIGPKRDIIAFSTELDSIHGQFTAGDLLFRSSIAAIDGMIIPNAALLAQTRMRGRYDIGLDAVSFTGEREAMAEALRAIADLGRDRLQKEPRLLAEILTKFQVDILFSTEGTSPTQTKPDFIDGDLLSAATGAIFRSNSALLPALPAGIPARGADFGLDAYTLGQDPETGGVEELISTEIIGRGRMPFTDGDALLPGPVLQYKNIQLLKSLTPPTEDLGLDALHLDLDRIACAAPIITDISEVPVGFINFATGLANSGGITDRPFGNYIRIQGALPDEISCPDFANFEYRVELDDGYGFPALSDPNTLAVPANWSRKVDANPNPLILDCPIGPPNDIYDPKPGGWFDVADYRRWDECSYGDNESLAVWNSSAFASNLNPGDPPVMVRFRIVMREIGAPAATYIGPPVQIRLDNTNYDLPVAKNMPLTGDISMTLAAAAGSGLTVNDCAVEGDPGSVVLDLLGRARDSHFWRYTLRWTGGNAVGWHGISPTVDSVFDNDGSDRAKISLTGTQPPNDTNVLLSSFDLSAAHQAATSGSELPIECGYTIEMRAWDRTIVGGFSAAANNFHGTVRWQEYPVSFCYKPTGS